VNRKSDNPLNSIRQSVWKLGSPFPVIPDNLHSSNDSPPFLLYIEEYEKFLNKYNIVVNR